MAISAYIPILVLGGIIFLGTIAMTVWYFCWQRPREQQRRGPAGVSVPIMITIPADVGGAMSPSGLPYAAGTTSTGIHSGTVDVSGADFQPPMATTGRIPADITFPTPGLTTPIQTVAQYASWDRKIPGVPRETYYSSINSPTTARNPVSGFVVPHHADNLSAAASLATDTDESMETSEFGSEQQMISSLEYDTSDSRKREAFPSARRHSPARQEEVRLGRHFGPLEEESSSSAATSSSNSANRAGGEHHGLGHLSVSNDEEEMSADYGRNTSEDRESQYGVREGVAAKIPTKKTFWSQRRPKQLTPIGTDKSMSIEATLEPTTSESMASPKKGTRSFSGSGGEHHSFDSPKIMKSINKVSASQEQMSSPQYDFFESARFSVVSPEESPLQPIDPDAFSVGNPFIDPYIRPGEMKSRTPELPQDGDEQNADFPPPRIRRRSLKSVK